MPLGVTPGPYVKHHIMKAAFFSLAIGASIARTAQALPDANGAITVTSVLPVMTISSCPPSGTELPEGASATPTDLSNVRTYTTVFTQPYSGGFVPMTYTVVGQPTGIPSGFTTGLAVVNGGTQIVTYPSASASGYIQSGYLTPDGSASVVTGGESQGQISATYSTETDSGSPTNAAVPANSNLGSTSAVHSDVPTYSGGVNGAIGSAGNSGSPSTHTTLSSNSTVPASKSSMAVYTGGANAGGLVDAIGGSMLAALLAGAALI